MDKRTTLALLLMAALLMIYPAIFMRQEPAKAPQKAEAPVAPPKQSEAAPPADVTPWFPCPRRKWRRYPSAPRSSRRRCIEQ